MAGEPRIAQTLRGGTGLARRAVGLLDPMLGRLALIAQRRRAEGVIALYHRVAPERNLLYEPLHPDEFDRHCVLLKRSFTVIPLSELLERHQRRQSLAGLCSITFDDGYLDFRDHALPILQSHGLSATQFLITECLETGQAPWNLRLERILLCSPSTENLRTAFTHLNRMPAAERERWLREHEAKLVAPSRLYRLPEMVSLSDLPDICGGSIEIGSHTVSHCSLGEIDAETARAELTDSLTRLRDLGHEVSVIAYPKGSVTRSIMELARAAGYRAGLAVGNHGIGPVSHPFGLPRFDITDRPVGMLRMELGGTIERLRGLRARARPRLSSLASAE